MTERLQKWDASTKRVVALILLIILALLVYRFSIVLLPLVLAFLIAFILNPIVNFLEQRVHLGRALATVLVFLGLILLLSVAPAVAVPPLVREIRSLNLDFEQIVTDIDRMLREPIVILGQEYDLRPVYRELWASLQGYLSDVAAGTVNIAVGFVSTLFWMVFIFLSAFYLVKDADRLVATLDSLAPPGMREDVVQLRNQITWVWHAFLRGQLLLGVVIGVVTTIAVSIIGLPNAIALGVLAGVLEFIPNIGPVLAAIPAVAVAFFEGSTWLPLEGFWFALLVVGVYVAIQQIESNLLTPLVMGSTLDMHPLVVLVAIIAGGSMAGVLGMLLAAPSVATLRVVAQYVYSRLTDRDPFSTEERDLPARRGLFRRLVDGTRRQVLADQWTVRLARAKDRADVEAFCAQVWNGDDYISEVWDEWLADAEGELTVVERHGQVVALAKLTRLAADEWWLEGLRVAPNYQRLGLARMLQTHQIQLAERSGAGGVIRFTTISDREPIRRNAARDGFRRVAGYQVYEVDALPGPSALWRLEAQDVDAAWAMIERSPVFARAGGLYEVFWHWKCLTRRRLAAHIEAGEVVGLRLDAGMALAILPGWDEPDGERLMVGYLDGPPEGVTALLWQLRTMANERGHEGLRFRLLDYPPLSQAVEEAGATRAWEKSMWIFERPLSGGQDELE